MKVNQAEVQKIIGYSVAKLFDLNKFLNYCERNAENMTLQTLRNWKEKNTAPSKSLTKSALNVVILEKNKLTIEKKYLSNPALLGPFFDGFNQALDKLNLDTEQRAPEKKLNSLQDIVPEFAAFWKEFQNNKFQKIPFRMVCGDNLDGEVTEDLPFYPFPTYLTISTQTFNFYIGREKQQKDMDELFVRFKQPIYLPSIGGMGKTTFARHYSRQSSRKNLFITVPSDEVKDVRLQLFDAIDPEMLKGLNKVETDQFLTSMMDDFVCKMAEYNSSILLIIDNVTTTAQLLSCEKLTPLCEIGWQILVTSKANADNDTIPTYSQRLCDFPPLSEENCLDLFRHFFKSEISEKDRPMLTTIFRHLGSHTYLIKLLAQVGFMGSLSIEKLQEIILTSNSLLPEDFLSFEVRDNDDTYHTIQEIIFRLFINSGLNQKEKRIMVYFAHLPNTSLNQELLVELMVKNQHEVLKNERITATELKLIFRKLFEMGWLIKRNNSTNQINYECHSLTQGALRIKFKNINEIVRPFVKNVGKFFSIKENGEEYLEKFHTLGVADAVLQKYKEPTIERFYLLQNYLKFRARFSSYKADSDAQNEEMWHLFNLLHPEEDSYNYKLKKVQCRNIYLTVFYEVSKMKGKAVWLLEERYKIFKETADFLPKDDLTYIRIERKWASMLTHNGKCSEAIHRLKDMKKRIKKKIDHQFGDQKQEWLYAYFKLLNLLGIAYNSKYLQKKDRSFLRQALATRKEYLKVGYEVLPKDSYTIRACYNDLGMTYCYMYDEYDKVKYLEKAKGYLQYSLEKAIERYGRNSHRVAIAQKNFSSYLIRNGNCNAAIDLTETAVKYRMEGSAIIFRRIHVTDYRFLGILYFKRYIHEKCLTDLKKSFCHYHFSLHLSDYLFGSKNNCLSKSTNEWLNKAKIEMHHCNILCWLPYGFFQANVHRRLLDPQILTKLC
ncbi:hypothetical protein NRIC_09350 [Enterococcus florum]|uniref:NB-ARC domain-containing protein n=1 Tax=Enterococcus florum TaxID=2480627 RepID=A0A4P5P9P0_9ENTE|nr:ATP-binding protein [Enterococcus florum]GCF93044.1 hypothetical protein NRIC_09350 [Enterococcus florum]